VPEFYGYTPGSQPANVTANLYARPPRVKEWAKDLDKEWHWLPIIAGQPHTAACRSAESESRRLEALLTSEGASLSVLTRRCKRRADKPAQPACCNQQVEWKSAPTLWVSRNDS
jgi:hypothetical protein